MNNIEGYVWLTAIRRYSDSCVKVKPSIEICWERLHTKDVTENFMNPIVPYSSAIEAQDVLPDLIKRFGIVWAKKLTMEIAENESEFDNFQDNNSLVIVNYLDHLSILGPSNNTKENELYGKSIFRNKFITFDNLNNALRVYYNQIKDISTIASFKLEEI